MHAAVHGGCTDTVSDSGLEGDNGKTSLSAQGIEPASVSRLAFQSYVTDT